MPFGSVRVALPAADTYNGWASDRSEEDFNVRSQKAEEEAVYLSIVI